MSDTMWSLACGDVIPGCPTVFTADTQDEILAQVLPHAAVDHDITEIDVATRMAVVAAMHQVPRSA